MTKTMKLIVLAAMLVAAAFGAKPVSCEIPVTFEIKDFDSNGAPYRIQSDGRGFYDGVIYCGGDATLNLLISKDRKVTAQFGKALDQSDPGYEVAQTVQAFIQVRNVLWAYNADTDYPFTTTFGSTWHFALGNRDFFMLNPCADNQPSSATISGKVNLERTTAKVDVHHIPASLALDGKETWVATPSTNTTPQCPTWPATESQVGATVYTNGRTTTLEGYYTVPFEIIIRRK